MASLLGLMHELHTYQPELAQRPSLICANKMDTGENAAKQLELLKKHTQMLVTFNCAPLATTMIVLERTLRGWEGWA